MGSQCCVAAVPTRPLLALVQYCWHAIPKLKPVVVPLTLCACTVVSLPLPLHTCLQSPALRCLGRPCPHHPQAAGCHNRQRQTAAAGLHRQLRQVRRDTRGGSHVQSQAGATPCHAMPSAVLGRSTSLSQWHFFTHIQSLNAWQPPRCSTIEHRTVLGAEHCWLLSCSAGG